MEELNEQIRIEDPTLDFEPNVEASGEGGEENMQAPGGAVPPTPSDPLEAFLHWQCLYIKYMQVRGCIEYANSEYYIISNNFSFYLFAILTRFFVILKSAMIRWSTHKREKRLR